MCIILDIKKKKNNFVSAFEFFAFLFLKIWKLEGPHHWYAQQLKVNILLNSDRESIWAGLFIFPNKTMKEKGNTNLEWLKTPFRLSSP